MSESRSRAPRRRRDDRALVPGATQRDRPAHGKRATVGARRRARGGRGALDRPDGRGVGVLLRRRLRRDDQRRSGVEAAATGATTRTCSLRSRRSDKPVVARVNGHAMGGGLGLVAASTFAVASTDAKLGTPEIDVGLFPMMIMAVLARHVPRRRLVEMMLLGQKFGAEEALRLGLVNRAVAPRSLDAEVTRNHGRDRDEEPDHRPPRAARFRGAGRPRPRARAAAAARTPRRVLATDDAREGLTAFLEKRAPQLDGEVRRTDADDARDGRRTSRRAARRCARWAAPTGSRKQHARGKMTARERLAALFDDGVFFEIGMHGTQMGLAAGPERHGQAGGRRRRDDVRQDRRAHGLRGGVRLHREGRQHRPDGRGEGDAPSLDGAQGALADGVAHRLGGRAHRPRVEPPRHDLALRRVGAPVPRAGA